MLTTLNYTFDHYFFSLPNLVQHFLNLDFLVPLVQQKYLKYCIPENFGKNITNVLMMLMMWPNGCGFKSPGLDHYQVNCHITKYWPEIFRWTMSDMCETKGSKHSNL